MKEKYKEILDEVGDEIDSSLRDSKGLAFHQRRLAFSLSLGIVTLIEVYLDGLNVLKPGAKINHLWLKKKRENVKELISKQISCPIENLKEIEEMLDVAYEIERERNELAYGKRASEELLKRKINLFLNLRNKLKDV
jgi:hypothetical protein